MHLSIIIVSWNTKDLLDKCLESIYKNKNNIDLEIFVVDNNSSDQTVEMIKDKYQQVKLITNNSNLGFAAANNQALKLASGEYTLLLNPDTEIINNSLSKALEFMTRNPNCGVMGAKLLNFDKTIQPSVRRLPTLWPILLMLFKAPKIFKNIKSIDRYLWVDFDYSKQQEVEQVMGAFMMVPKKIIDQIGFLDERFYIWFEEVDLCRRIRSIGSQVIYNPAVEIIHHGGQSFAQEKVIKKQLLFFKSALKYFLKHGFLNK